MERWRRWACGADAMWRSIHFLCARKWLLRSICAQNSLGQWGQGMMETDAGVGSAFPDLSALLCCCGPVRFAGFGAMLDGSTPLVSVGWATCSQSVCLNRKALRETFRVSLKRFFCPPWEHLPSKSSRTTFSLVVGGLPCEPRAGPSGAGTASGWCRRWGGQTFWRLTE